MADAVEQLLLESRPEQINYDFNADGFFESAGRSFVKLYDPKGTALAIEYQTYNTVDSKYGFPITALDTNSITIGAGHDHSTQIKAGMFMRVEGSVSNDGIYEISAVDPYASEGHVVTVIETIPDTLDVTGRVTWLRSEVARTGGEFDQTATDDDGNTVPYESGEVGSDEEVWRIFTAKLLRTHNNAIHIRCEFTNELGNIDYVYANHTYDVDTRADLIDYDAWVDPSGELILSFSGDEDMRSMVYMYQNTPFSHASFSAMIADFRANGIVIQDINQTDPDGYHTGEFISGADPLYVALLPYGEASPTLATSEEYGLYATYLYVDTISSTVEYRVIKSQTEEVDATYGFKIRKGKLVLRVTDAVGSVTGVEARYTDHGKATAVSGSSVDRFTAWAAMSNDGQKTYNITGVDQGAKTFTFAEDVTSDFYPGQKLEVTGANAGVYTISTVTYTTSSAVVVLEAIGSATVDGTGGIKGQVDYSVSATLSEKDTTFVEWEIATDRGLPITGSESFDFDTIPELSRLNADLTYDFTGDEFTFNLNYEWDEDVASIKLLLHNSLSGVSFNPNYPAAQDPKWAGTGVSPPTVLINEVTPDGLIQFKVGDTVAAGGMSSIDRGDYLWWYAIALDGDGRANAQVYAGRILVAATPKVIATYDQSNGFASAKIWIKDHAPAGETYIESIKYRVGKPIAPGAGYSTLATLTADTSGPDGSVGWDGYYAIGGSGDSFLLDRKHNLQLEWIAQFKKYVQGTTAISGSHTYDSDRNATVRTATLRRVAVGNNAYKVVLDYFGDEDTSGLAWKYEQKSTEGPTAGLGYDPAVDALQAGEFSNNQNETDLEIIDSATYDPKQWVYVALTALPKKNDNDDDWIASDTLDVLGVPTTPIIVSLGPDAIAPRVEVTESQTGTIGDLTIVVDDPQLRVTGATYNIQTSPSTGYGGEIAWTPTGTTTKTYQRNVPLSTKNQTFVQWKITYTDGDGTSRNITGVSSFDRDNKAEWAVQPQLSVNASNQPVFTWDMDEDGTQVRYETSTTGPVTSFSGSATVDTNNSGSATFTAISEGETFYILARAEKSDGAEGGDTYADSVILPSYTASPTSLANARLTVSNGTLRIGYTGGSSVVGTYYTVSTDETFNIDAVNTTSETITVNGEDLTDRFGIDDVVTIAGSTGNNGDYTITDISFSGGNTTFTFGGDDLTNATADGTVTMKTLRDPDVDDNQIAQQVAYVDTAIPISDGVTVTVKIAGYDDATPTPNLGTVYPLVVTADSNTAPQIFWVNLDIDPGGKIHLNVGADDDTTDIYYETSTSAMPAGPITTADTTTGQGSGVVTLTGASLDPSQTIYIRLAAYNSATSEFGPEWQLRGTFQELPDFDTKPAIEVLSTTDVTTQSGWGKGQASVEFNLNPAADRINYRVAHGGVPAGAWTTKVLTAGAAGTISHAELLLTSSNYATTSGIPEGKHVVIQVQASDGVKDGKIYQLAQMYGTGDTIIPTYVIGPSYGYDAINDWYYGRLQIDVEDPQGRIVESAGVDQVKFAKKVGLQSFSSFALRDGGTDDTHYADVQLDPDHGSEIKYQVPWLKKDGTQANMEGAYSFVTPIDPKILGLNFTWGSLVTLDGDPNQWKYPIYLSWDANRDTESIRYAVGTALPGSTAGGTVRNARSGNAELVGYFAHETDVYVLVEPFSATAAGGTAGETASAHARTPENPRLPYFEDNKIKPLMLANPPFSGSVDAAPIADPGTGKWYENQLAISGSITIPGHGAKTISHSGVVSAGALVWDTTGDPEVGLTFGGDPSAEGVFLIGYIDDVGNADGSPPFYVTANGKGIFSNPVIYAGSFTALMANIKVLEVEKEFALLPGGVFSSNALYTGLDRTRGTFIDDTGIEGWSGGVRQAYWNSGTGEIEAGGGAVRLTVEGIEIDTPAFGAGSLKLSDEGIDLPFGVGAGKTGDVAASLSWGSAALAAFQDTATTDTVFALSGAARLVIDGDFRLDPGQEIRTDTVTTADTLADLNLTTLGSGSVSIKGVAFPHDLSGKAGYALSVNATADGIEWTPGAGTLAGLGDVSVSETVADDHILVRSGTDWVNVLGTTKFAAASHTLDSHTGRLSVNKLSLPSAPTAAYFLKADFDTDASWSTLTTADITDFPASLPPSSHSYDSHTGTVPVSDVATNAIDGGTQVLGATDGGTPGWIDTPLAPHTLADHSGTLAVGSLTAPTSGVRFIRGTSGTPGSVAWSTLTHNDIIDFDAESKALIGPWLAGGAHVGIDVAYASGNVSISHGATSPGTEVGTPGSNNGIVSFMKDSYGHIGAISTKAFASQIHSHSASDINTLAPGAGTNGETYYLGYVHDTEAVNTAGWIAIGDHAHVSTDITDFNTAAKAAVGPLLQAGPHSGITVSYTAPPGEALSINHKALGLTDDATIGATSGLNAVVGLGRDEFGHIGNVFTTPVAAASHSHAITDLTPTASVTAQFLKSTSGGGNTWADLTVTDFPGLDDYITDTAGGVVEAGVNAGSGLSASYTPATNTLIISHADTNDGNTSVSAPAGQAITAINVDGFGHVNPVMFTTQAFADVGHTHDDRYYTETEINNTLSGYVTDLDLTNQLSGYALQTWVNTNFIDTTEIGAYATNTALSNHTASTLNPHNVTAAQLNLGNVEDVALSTWAGSTSITTVAAAAVTAHQAALSITTSQISDWGIATGGFVTDGDLTGYATQTWVSDNYIDNTEIGAYATNTALSNHTASTLNPHNVTKEQVQLGNVENVALSSWDVPHGNITGGGAGAKFLRSTNGGAPFWGDLTGSHTHVFADITDATGEVQDIAGALIAGGIGGGLTGSYTNLTNTFTISHGSTTPDTLVGNSSGSAVGIVGFNVDSYGHTGSGGLQTTTFSTPGHGHVVGDLTGAGAGVYFLQSAAGTVQWTQGETRAGTWISDLRINGNNIEVKTRVITTQGGMVTDISDESGWTVKGTLP